MKKLNKKEMERLSKMCKTVLNGINPLNDKIIKRRPDKKPIEVFEYFKNKYSEVDFFILGYTDKTGSGKAEIAYYIAIPTKHIDYNIFSCMFVDCERYNKMDKKYICNDVSFKNRKYFTDLLNTFKDKITEVKVNDFIYINSNKGISFEIYLDTLLKGNNSNINSTALYDIELKNKKYQIKCAYEGNNTSEVLSYNKNDLNDIDNITSRLYRD